LFETIDIWRWLLTGTPPRPVASDQHRPALMAERILQYGDYLAAAQLPSPPEEIGLLISAAVIPPGKRTPSRRSR